MNPEMFCLLKFVRFEYCSTDVIDDLFNLFWENSYEVNAPMWATLCARLVLPNGTWKKFAPSVKKGKTEDLWGRKVEIDVPDGIIAHLTREVETIGTNPDSGADDTRPNYAAKKAADLEAGSSLFSAYRRKEEDIPRTPNNWV
jgi:hypothetical protein